MKRPPTDCVVDAPRRCAWLAPCCRYRSPFGGRLALVCGLQQELRYEPKGAEQTQNSGVSDGGFRKVSLAPPGKKPRRKFPLTPSPIEQRRRFSVACLSISSTLERMSGPAEAAFCPKVHTYYSQFQGRRPQRVAAEAPGFRPEAGISPTHLGTWQCEPSWDSTLDRDWCLCGTGTRATGDYPDSSRRGRWFVRALAGHLA